MPKTNSYGTLDSIIDSGLLTNKPLEYRIQIPKNNMKDVVDYNRIYVDLTPIIDHLLVIKKYRERWEQIQRLGSDHTHFMEKSSKMKDRARGLGVTLKSNAHFCFRENSHHIQTRVDD